MNWRQRRIASAAVLLALSQLPFVLSATAAQKREMRISAASEVSTPAIPDVLRRYLRGEAVFAGPDNVTDSIIKIDGFPIYQTTTGTFLLMRMETLDEDSSLLPPSPEILDFAKPYEQYINLDPEVRFTADLPSLGIPLPIPAVDHSAAQTPVRSQGDRPTCVAHAALAAMEAYVGDPNLNLSEEYANHRFMRFLGAQCCKQPDPMNPGEVIEPNTVTAAGYLKQIEIPTEANDPWKYHSNWPMCDIRTDCDAPQHDDLPVSPPLYTLAKFDAISKFSGLRGPSIQNSAYLETILASGYDVVIAMGLAWPAGAEGAVIPVYMSQGMPRKPSGGHAMLLVGYDRTGKYFIAKNSMGPTWGYNRSGYARLSYGYIATYARYGFIVRSVMVR